MGVGVKKNLIDREQMKEYIEDVLKKNPDMFPTSNKIERKLRMRGMKASGSIVMEAIGGSAKLDELKINWIEKCGEEAFIDALKNQAFSASKGKVRGAFEKRLHTVLHINVHRLPEMFGPSAIKNYLKNVPGLRAEYDKNFGIRKDKPQKRNGRTVQHT